GRAPRRAAVRGAMALARECNGQERPRVHRDDIPHRRRRCERNGGPGSAIVLAALQLIVLLDVEGVRRRAPEEDQQPTGTDRLPGEATVAAPKEAAAYRVDGVRLGGTEREGADALRRQVVVR